MYIFSIRFSLFCRGDVVAEAGHEEELLLVDVGMQRIAMFMRNVYSY